MSYYTYFKLKEDSKYKNWKPENYRSYNGFLYSKAEFIVEMISAYYENDSHKKVNIIRNAFMQYINNDLYNTDQEYLKDMFEDENHELCKNHAKDEYEMQEIVDNWKDTIEDTIQSLCILSSIKFEKDDRYSDTPKTLMEYLQYAYINSINEILEYFKYNLEEYTFSKFVLENCTSMSEDEETSASDNDYGVGCDNNKEIAN